MLFERLKLRDIELQNRLISAAIYEVAAGPDGEMSDRIIERYRKLAKAGTGLVVPGYMYVSHQGKTGRYQTGIHHDELIPGLKRLTDAVHDEGGRIIFQLHHGGRQCDRAITGMPQISPSAASLDPVFMTRGRKMTEAQIFQIIEDFRQAARRAVEAGADGVQLHGANGFLLNQFLSPFFNRRKDEWGGSIDGRFRFFSEVFTAVREAVPKELPVLVKLNVNENLKGGITPDLAKEYIRRMVQLGIDGLEPAQGTVSFNNFFIWRGDIPAREMAYSFPLWMKPVVWLMMKSLKGKFDLSPAYVLNNLNGVKQILGDIPLFSGGGVRTREEMDEILESGKADAIALGRPFLRQPTLARQFRERGAKKVQCTSCNKCVAAANADLPMACYSRGIPKL